MGKILGKSDSCNLPFLFYPDEEIKKLFLRTRSFNRRIFDNSSICTYLLRKPKAER